MIFFDKNNNPFISLNGRIVKFKDDTWKYTEIYTSVLNTLKSGDLIYGGSGGYLSQISGETTKKKLLNFTKIYSNYIPAISIDSGGMKYITFGNSFQEGYANYYNNKWHYYNVDSNYPEFILADSKGIIWAIDQAFKIYNLVENGSRIVFSSDSLDINESFAPGNKIVEDLNSNIWIGGDQAIYQYDRKKWIRHANFKDSIINISSSCVDKDNNKWFFSKTGRLLKYDNYKWEIIQMPFKYNNDVYYMDSDINGNIWIANSTNGIWKYDGKIIKQIDTDNILKNESITGCKIEKETGHLWVLSNNYTARFDGFTWDYPFEKYDIKNIYFTCIERDVDSTYWLGSLRNGLFHWKEGEEVITNIENSIDANKSDTKDFSVYPNPAHSNLFFKSKNMITEIKIYNCFGELLVNDNLINKNSIELQSNIFHNNTLYFYKANDEHKNVYSGKFLYFK